MVVRANYIVAEAYIPNAFAGIPPPFAPLYVRIDSNYKRWYTTISNRPSIPY